MRTAKHYFGVLFAFVITAAGLSGPVMAESGTGELEIRTFYLQDYDSDTYTTFGTGHYQQISLSREGKEAYPSLAGALDRYNSKTGAEQTESFNDACKDARDIREENDYTYEVSQETDIYPRRTDDQVFSFLTYYIGYTGGAHGYYCWTGYNFDPETGEELLLTDVFTDEQALKDVIWDLLLEKYPDGSIGKMGATMENYGTGEGLQPFNWVAGPYGVTFIFNPYELASYAEGAQFVTLGFSEYESLYTGRVQKQEGNFCCRLNSWIEEDVDPDGDGNLQRLVITENRDDGMEISGLTVQLGGQECTAEKYFWSYTPYLMHTEDGRTYLYVETVMENDYRQTEVIALDSGEPVHTATIDAALPIRWEDLVSISEFPTDPQCFRMSSRINMLSTYSGIREYTLAGGSYGEPLSESWQVEYAPDLTVIRDLPVYAVDPENGSVSDTQILVPAGEEVCVTATDGESWADLRRADGTIVRVYVDTKEYPHKISGLDEADYFEMLYYAG